MRKLIAGLMAMFVLVLALTGCGGSGGGAPNPFAGRWAGPCLEAPSGDIVQVDLDVTTNGQFILAVGGDGYTGIVDHSGIFAGVKGISLALDPVFGAVRHDNGKLQIILTRGGKVIAGAIQAGTAPVAIGRDELQIRHEAAVKMLGDRVNL